MLSSSTPQQRVRMRRLVPLLVLPQLAATSFALTFLALLLVVVLAMAAAGMLGWTIERIAYRPLRGSFRLAPLITAIGMSIMLQNYIQFSQGARVKPLQPIIGGGYTIMHSGGFAVQP